MRATLLSRLTYSNVMVTALMFIVLGGGAYAAVNLPKNSVESKHIAPNAAKAADVDEASLDANILQSRVSDTCPDGAAIQSVDEDGAVTCESSGAQGQQGPQGDQGDAGLNGSNGAACLPSNPACVGPDGPEGAPGPTGPTGAVTGRYAMGNAAPTPATATVFTAPGFAEIVGTCGFISTTGTYAYVQFKNKSGVTLEVMWDDGGVTPSRGPLISNDGLSQPAGSAQGANGVDRLTYYASQNHTGGIGATIEVTWWIAGSTCVFHTVAWK